MSPKARFSPSRWSPIYFNQGSEELTSDCPKTEPPNQSESEDVHHNTAVKSQDNGALKTMTEISISQGSRSSSPSLSNSTSHLGSHLRSRSRSRSREGKRDSATSGGGWDSRFHESPPILNVRLGRAAGQQSLTDNRDYVQNSYFFASSSHGRCRFRELANHNRCQNKMSFTEDRELGGGGRSRSAERQNFDRRSVSAQPTSLSG